MPNTIPTVDARSVFNKMLVARWNELMELAPKSFLRSFFTMRTTDTKEVSVEVKRGTEKIAVDVLRGTNGNRNRIDRFSERVIIPPFYNEFFDATELDKYDLLFGQGVTQVSSNTLSDVIMSAMEKLELLKQKIERSYELQAAQVFNTGIVTLNSAENIDFKRKSASIVVKASNAYWTIDTIDPREDLKAAGNFLRQTGRAMDGEFICVMGQSVISALLANPNVTNDDIKDVGLVDLKMPQSSSEGGVYHGMLSAGSYRIHLWSYPQYYDNSAGTSTPYIPNNRYFLLPMTSGQFVMSYAGVPKIVRDMRNAEFPELITNVAQDYVINNYIDPFAKKHVFEVLSAGLAIPVSIDRIYTSQVTA